MIKGFTPLEIPLTRGNLLRMNNNAVQSKSLTGFTLIEAVAGIAIILLLSLLSGPAMRMFQHTSAVSNTAEELAAALSEAQSNAKGSKGDRPWGVFIDASTDPDRYVLFQGFSFAERNVAQDKIFNVPSGVEFSLVSLGQGNEAVFQKVTGYPVPSGIIVARSSADQSQAKTVSLNASGAIMVGEFSNLSDEDRVKDSRHVHVFYAGRAIDTATESVRLALPDVVQTIPMTDNLQGQAFSWEGEVISQGETQRIRIHTHALNDPLIGTQFSVHRDRRYNTKALIIELSGDSTGNLLQYDSAGQTSNGTSVYAATPFWQ